MQEKLKRRIMTAWREVPAELRHAAATPEEITAFEKRFGPMPSELRWFLESCGGGTVGSAWIDDIEKLVETHKKFSRESALPNGWSMKDVFVIGWDGAGNPFGIQASTGKILVEDHDFGGVHELAPSLAAFLEHQLLDEE